MKWIIVTIILFMGAYTYLTLHFRKPNRSYEPFNDIKNRGQTNNLLTAGYQRKALEAVEPTNEPTVEATAQVSPTPAGLPLDLRNSLFDQPRLPDSVLKVQAPARVSGLLPFHIIFDCTFANDQQQFSGAYLYVRDSHIVLVPEFEDLDGNLESRNRKSHVQLEIPGGTIKPGTYQVLLIGGKSSLTWALQVN